METGIIEGVTEVIESKTEAICDRSALPDGTALENGRYEIRTTLGNGGFGITYKAWDYRLQRYVAIKEFFPDGFAYRDAGQSREVRCIQDAQTFQHGKHRFQKEAQLLAKLDFSHIVRVYDSFEENNTGYIVMEYINGETLSRYVRRTGPMAAAYLRELFLPLLRDLDAVHRAGMLHRDISPDNIMVTTDYGQLKLIDFGTAKDLTRVNEKTMGYSVSQSVVRMNYSPLEMFSSVEKQPSADIYSLCATMYFCLTGEEPLSSMDRAFDDTLPSGLNALDRSMSRVILKGMSLKPEDRYASAEELIQALGGQTKERKPRQERKPQQEQKTQKGTLKWLPAVLGCIAAIAVLVLIPVALLTGRGEQSGNAKRAQQLIAAPTIKNTQTENTKQEETPGTPEETASEADSSEPAAPTTPEETSEEPEDTASKTDSSKAAAPAAPEASTAGEASKAGTYEENEYRNDFFGFRISLDDKWQDDALQDLNAPYLEAQGATADQTPDEIIDNMEVDDALYTVAQLSYEDLAAVRVLVTRIGLNGAAFTTTDILVDMTMRMMAEAAPDAELSEKSISFGTRTIPVIYGANVLRDTDGSEVPIYMEILFMKSRDYMAAIYLISYQEDNLDSLLQRVSPL